MGFTAWGMVCLTFLSVGAEPPSPPLPPQWPEAPLPSGKGWRKEVWIESLPMGGHLLVQNRNGSIRVEGWDREEVRLEADVRDSSRRRVKVLIERRDKGLAINTQYEREGWGFSFGLVPSPFCEMTLRVPYKIFLRCVTVNGSVMVRETKGAVHLESTNGDILLRDFRGEAKVITTNGHIEARRLRARIGGQTASGNLVLEGVMGGINLRTLSGNVKVRGLDGWGEGIMLRTGSGSMDVELGNASGELEVFSGRAALDVSLRGVEDRDPAEDRFLGRIPGKTQKILIESEGGRVRVRQ